MSSEDSHYSSRSHRPSKHMNEPRGSSASTKRSQSSISNQARAPGTNSHHGSASGKSWPEGSQAGTSRSSAESRAASSNITPIPSNEGFNSQHYIVRKYAAQVLSGTSSLPIDAPPYLQQALVDQHGNWSTRECLDSTFGGQMDSSVGSQYPGFSLTPQQDQWYSTYANNDGYADGDLTGIGAQFYS